MILFPTWTPGLILLHVLAGAAVVVLGFEYRLGFIAGRQANFRSRSGNGAKLWRFMVYFLPILVFGWFARPYLWQETDVQYLIGAALVGHFSKRCLEVLFVHRSVRAAEPGALVSVGLLYAAIAGGAAYLNQWAQAKVDSLFLAGLGLFLMGEGLNLVHHLLLAALRRNSRLYGVPYGGLFRWVSCPHYLGELIAWLGLVLMARHLFLALVFLAMALYLGGRARRIHAWNLANLPGYPQNRKAIFPFLL